MWALREAGASDVAVWNRTPERAQALARDLGVRAVGRARAGRSARQLHLGRPARTAGLERSATEHRALNQLGLAFDQIGEYSYVVDLVYRSPSTPLLAAAGAHGARTLDGLEILVAQGALSFELWTGREPRCEVMRAAACGEDRRDLAGAARGGAR